MKRLMSLVVAGGIAASLVMSAGPASAAGTAKVYFAQGWVAKTVDVCIDGVEVHSDLGYRKKSLTELNVALDTQDFAFAVYTANDATTCGAAPLASHTYTLAGDKNYTVISGIGSSHMPRLFLFSNPVQNTPPHTARFSYRHAADVGAVNAALIGEQIWRNIPNGGSVTGIFDEGTYRLRSRRSGNPADLHAIRNLTLASRVAYQVYLVGDQANGYGTITIQQPVVQPTP
jgi:uncharacterized protein DUF4397